ncbi:MAG: hypothetical protein AAF846_04765 [Chloroflexota bacterium]
MTVLPSRDDNTSSEEQQFYLLVASVFFAVISGLMFLFAMTFIRDLQTLRSVPDALWNFLCGTPTDNQIALPLLLTIGIVTIGLSGVLQIWRLKLVRRGET